LEAAAPGRGGATQRPPAAVMQLKIALEKVLSETSAGKHNDVREAAQAALERLKALQVRALPVGTGGPDAVQQADP